MNRGSAPGPWASHPRAVVVALGVAAALLSFAGSGVPSFWSDEVATVRATLLPLPHLLEFLRYRDAVHGLYYAILHGWALVFGSSELALRAPSAIAVGIATVGIALLGRRLHSLRAGLLAGVVFAVLPRTTYMGAEARSYALTAAVATFLTLLLLLAAAGSRWLFAAYGLLALVGLLLFAYLGLLLLAHAVVLALLRPDRRRWAAFTAAVVLPVGIASPFLVAVAGQRGQIAWLGSQPVLNGWTVLVEPWFESSVAVAIVGWGLVVGCGVWWLRSARPAPPALARSVLGGAVLPLGVASAWVVVPTVILLLANIPFGPLYTARYLSFCAPGMALLLGTLLSLIPSRGLGAGLVILLVLAAVPTAVAQRGPFAKNGGSDLRQLAEVVHDHASPGDAVVFGRAPHAALAPRQALYGYPADFAGLDDVALVRSFPASHTLSDVTLPLDRLGDRLAGHRVVWLLVPSRTNDCGATRDGRVLASLGYESARSFPVHRTSACEFVAR